MCFGQGIKCGERNVNLLDLINDLKKALEVMKNMKELDNKEVHSSFVSADNVSCAKRYATSTLNFPPFFVANNNVKIIEIKEIDK
jgi:hypothetical protein